MTMGDTLTVQLPVRVRYHECDPQGVVFNAHYLAYADMACFAAITAVAGGHAALHQRGIDLTLAEATVRYRAPCHFDDELTVTAVIDRVGTTSLVLRFPMHRDGEVVCDVINRYVWVDTHQYRPTAPPADLADAFRQLEASTHPDSPGAE